MDHKIEHDCGCLYIQQSCRTCNKVYELEYTCFNCFKESIMDPLCHYCEIGKDNNNDLDGNTSDRVQYCCDCHEISDEIISNVQYDIIE